MISFNCQVLACVGHYDPLVKFKISGFHSNLAYYNKFMKYFTENVIYLKNMMKSYSYSIDFNNNSDNRMFNKHVVSLNSVVKFVYPNLTIYFLNNPPTFRIVSISTVGYSVNAKKQPILLALKAKGRFKSKNKLLTFK